MYAFALLNAILLSGPKDILMPNYFRQIFMIIFRRLQSCKREKFMKGLLNHSCYYYYLLSISLTFVLLMDTCCLVYNDSQSVSQSATM